MYDIRSIHSYIRLPDNKTYNEVVNELVNINIRINNIQRVEHPLVRDHSVATPALLCHNDTAQVGSFNVSGIRARRRNIFFSVHGSLLSYAIKTKHF